jgi:hypothetical protein
MPVGEARLVAAAASTTAAVTALVALFALAAASLVFASMGSTAFTALVVLAIFVAFVTFEAVAGLATARRLVVVFFRSAVRGRLLRATSAFRVLFVFLFRISTVVVFLSVLVLRAAALLLGVPPRVLV